MDTNIIENYNSLSEILRRHFELGTCLEEAKEFLKQKVVTIVSFSEPGSTIHPLCNTIDALDTLDKTINLLSICYTQIEFMYSGIPEECINSRRIISKQISKIIDIVENYGYENLTNQLINAIFLLEENSKAQFECKFAIITLISIYALYYS